jgi:NitT/TauT family transport system substrate-binding protein
MVDNATALRQGEVDVVPLFEPFADELIAAGEGHLWYAVAARGPTAYTSFYMRRRVLASRRDDMKKLVRGLYRTQKWLHAPPPAALADAVQSFFPSVPPTLLCAAVARYHMR